MLYAPPTTLKEHDMNYFKIVFALFFTCLCFCSCVDAPNSLNQEETEFSSENTTELSDNQGDHFNAVSSFADEIIQVKRGNLETIRDQLSLDLQNTYKNISVSYARVSDADEMPTCDISVGVNPTFTLDNILRRLYGDRYDLGNESYYRHHRIGEPINEEYPALTEPTYINGGEFIMPRNVYDVDIDTFAPDYNRDATLSVIMYSTGNIFGSECGGGLWKDNDWFDYTDKEIYKRYYLKYEQPFTDEAYTMVDGKEWNALEAVDFVEKFWQEYITPSDKYVFTYSVKALYVIRIDSSHFAYLFEIQKQDENGNYYDVDKAEFYLYDESVLTGEPFIYTNRLVTYCAEKESITRFGKDFSFDLSNQTDDGDNLLTLSAATDLLSKALASNINLNLTAELNYMVVCKGYTCANSWIKKNFYSDLCLKDCNFEIRPYWCFKPVGQCFLINELEAERYYVDAITGEVSTVVMLRYQKYEP